MPLRRRKPIHPAYATLGEAIGYLRSVCDGAIKRDGYGFSTQDVAIGHHLAAKAHARWSPTERGHALRLVRIYQRQLSNARYQPQAILRQRKPQRCSRRRHANFHPGWFTDPTGLSTWRYWNGARWTQHTASAVEHTKVAAT